MTVGDERDGLRPSQSGAFAFGIVRAFSPRVQRVQPLLLFSDCAQILPMHIQTVRAAVDLRGAQPDQMKQSLFQSTVLQVLLDADHGFVDTWGGFVIAETSFHKSS